MLLVYVHVFYLHKVYLYLSLSREGENRHCCIFLIHLQLESSFLQFLFVCDVEEYLRTVARKIRQLRKVKVGLFHRAALF